MYRECVYIGEWCVQGMCLYWRLVCTGNVFILENGVYKESVFVLEVSVYRECIYIGEWCVQGMCLYWRLVCTGNVFILENGVYKECVCTGG